MAKKKSITNLLAETFSNGKLSLVISDKSAREAVETQLQRNHIAYSVDDLPKMDSGKVVGCYKQITVKDSDKLFEVIKKTNSFE